MANTDYEDHGWHCAVHGYQVDGSPDACLKVNCNAYVPLSRAERDAYNDGYRGLPNGGEHPIMPSTVDRLERECHRDEDGVGHALLCLGCHRDLQSHRGTLTRSGGCPYCGSIRFQEYRFDLEPTSIMKQDYYNWHPSGVECKEIAAAFPFNLGAAIKYIWRAGRKDRTKQIEDLTKARNHIQFEIDRLERES